MATTRSKKGAKGKRVWLALGLVALALVGYLWYRSRSSSALAASPSGASATSPLSSDQGGGTGGGSASTPDNSGLLSTLAGENQALLSAFLSGEQGLLSLAAHSPGQPTANQSVPEPSGSSTPSPGPSPDTSAPTVSQAFGAVPSGEAGAIQQAAAYQGGAPSVLAPNLDSGASSAGVGEAGAGAEAGADIGSMSVAPVYSPPVYGVTYGAPAGQRASSTKTQGVISVH